MSTERKLKTAILDKIKNRRDFLSNEYSYEKISSDQSVKALLLGAEYELDALQGYITLVGGLGRFTFSAYIIDREKELKRKLLKAIKNKYDDATFKMFIRGAKQELNVMYSEVLALKSS